VLVFVLLNDGLTTEPGAGAIGPGGVPFRTLPATVDADGNVSGVEGFTAQGNFEAGKNTLVKMADADGGESWWHLTTDDEDKPIVTEALWRTELGSPVTDADGDEVSILLNGKPITESMPLQAGFVADLVHNGEPTKEAKGLSFVEFLGDIKSSVIVRFLKTEKFADGDDTVVVFYQVRTLGKDIMRPGLKFKVDADKGATTMDRLNFASLMLALFCGTASLPHILIRYYTVPSPACARKSTIVAILAIGLFYVLTMFMGLGAMVGGVVDVASNNMSAPLLAKTFGIGLFAIISAIAFATVLGTVSGLIVAASGAVAHDLMDRFAGMKLTDKGKVTAGKIAAIGVGMIAIVLGILFKGMNVSYLVGWAFAVAASANLPAIIMLLFWKRTTKRGIAFSVVVGMISAVGLILLSPDMYERYGMARDAAPFGLNNPGIVSIPLAFLTLIVVSLLTKPEPVKADA
jgi:cation/acetate symporter